MFHLINDNYGKVEQFTKSLRQPLLQTLFMLVSIWYSCHPQ